jgi:predicted ATPase
VLKSIQLANFRGFRDHTVDFTPFCLLIGQNNAGKTTLIEALRLISTALKRAVTANYQMAPEYISQGLTGPVFRFATDTIGIEHKSIHYNYRSEEPAIIRARFNNNSIVAVAVGQDQSDFFCQLLLPGGKKLNSRSQYNARRFPPIHVMPPVGSLLDRETFRDRAYMRKHIDGYLSHRHIRNQMAEMPAEYERFKAQLEATWDHVLQVGPVEYGLGEKADEYGVTIRDGPFVSEMGLVGSGLQAWIQTLWFLSRVSFDSTIVLDEPDIYLHADLQRKLIQILAGGGSSQTVIATHSLEMISSVSAGEIISVTKREPRSKALTSNAQAQALADKLGTTQNLQLSKLAQAGRVLFVEGKDHSFLDQLAFKRGNLFYDRFGKIPHFPIGGMANWPRAAMTANVFHETSDGRIKSILLIDRDYKPQPVLDQVCEDAEKAHLEVVIWSRKEIENYFLCAPTTTEFLRSRTDKGVDRALVEDLMTQVLEELRAELTELVADSYQAADRKLALTTAMSRARDYIAQREAAGFSTIDLISGKAAISRLSAVSKDRFGISFAPMSLCRQMAKQAVPAEINRLLEKLVP